MLNTTGLRPHAWMPWCLALFLVSATPAAAEIMVGSPSVGVEAHFPAQLDAGFARWLKSRGRSAHVVLLDSQGRYAYVVCNGTPSVITKLELGQTGDSPRVAGELTLPGWYNNVIAGVLDEARGHGYLLRQPRSIVKVRLGDDDEPPALIHGPSATLPVACSALAIDGAQGAVYALSSQSIFKLAMGDDDAQPTFDPGWSLTLPAPQLIAAWTLRTDLGFGVVAAGATSNNIVRIHRFALTPPGTEGSASEAEAIQTPDRRAHVHWLQWLPGDSALYAGVIGADGARSVYVFGEEDEDPATVVRAQLQLPPVSGTFGPAFPDPDTGSLFAIANNALERYSISPGDEPLAHDATHAFSTYGTGEREGIEFDPATGQLMMAFRGPAGAGPTVAHLESGVEGLDEIGLLALPPPTQNFRFAFELPGSRDLLLGAGTSPGQIVVVPAAHFDDFERPVPRLTLDIADGALRSAAFDPASGQLLVGLDNGASGTLLQVFPGEGDEAPTRGHLVEVDGAPMVPACAVFDEVSRTALFGSDTAPGRIIAVALGEAQNPPALLDDVALELGDDALRHAYLDRNTGYAYFTVEGAAKRLLKINTRGGPAYRASALNLGDIGNITCLLGDPGASHLYLFTDNPGAVRKIAMGNGDASPTILRTRTNSIFAAQTGVLRPDLGRAFLSVRPAQVDEFAYSDARALSDRLTWKAPNGPLPSGPFRLSMASPDTDRIYFISGSTPPAIFPLDATPLPFTYATRVRLREVATVTSANTYALRAGATIQLAIYDDTVLEPTLPTGLGGTMQQLSAASDSYAWPNQRIWESPVFESGESPAWHELSINQGSPATLRLPEGTYWIAWQSAATSPAIGWVGCDWEHGALDSVQIPRDWDEFPVQLTTGFTGSAVRKDCGAWATNLTVEYDPRVESITPLVNSPTGADPVRFDVRFNTDVQGFDSGDDLLIIHDGTAHGTVIIEGEGKRRTVSVGDLSGPGSFTVSVRTDTGVRNFSEVPLQSTMTSPPVVFSQGYWDGGAGGRHAADTNRDGRLSLSEVLRVIQFYNSGGLHCADPFAPVDDGFEPGDKPESRDCAPHSSDYAPHNWRITLTELLRLVQFYNAGGYHPCATGEDGFCPGPVT